MRKPLFTTLTFCFLCLAATAAQAQDITTGLQHYYTFDETGGSVANDSIGGNNGTLVNWGAGETSFTPGIMGGSILFDTSDNHVITDSAINFDEYTIAFWQRQDSHTGLNPRLFNPVDELWVYQELSQGRGIGIQTVRHEPELNVRGVWDHYAVTIDRVGGAASVYFNGSLAATGAVSLNAPTTQWLFGHHQDPGNSNDTWDGALDDVRFYDRQLSVSDINALVDLAPKTPGLVSHLVAPATDFGGQPTGEYDSQSISLFIDPSQTSWIAWNRRDELRAMLPTLPGQLLLGSLRPGVDDEFDLTITNPNNESLTLKYDENGVGGHPEGQQAVIFGTAADAPDVLRGDNLSSPFVFDEAGAHNAIFTVAGEYQFDFSFGNIGSLASYPDVYLLVKTVPEPSSFALAGLGVVGLGVFARRRGKKQV